MCGTAYEQIGQGDGVRVEDGWMTCEFTSFSTVFQSYQDDERLIIMD